MTIKQDKDFMDGAPTIKGIPVHIVVFKATAYADEIAADFDQLSKDDVLEALNYTVDVVISTKWLNWLFKRRQWKKMPNRASGAWDEDRIGAYNESN